MMKLKELLDIVIDSTPYEWRDIGPGSVSLDEDDHGMFAVYKPDVSLSLAWGQQYMGSPLDGPGYEWRKKFVVHDVTAYYADVRWNGVTVHREMLLSVDGSAGHTLPAPSLRAEETLANRITPMQREFARLICSIPNEQGNTVDSAIEQAGFVVADDDFLLSRMEDF